MSCYLNCWKMIPEVDRIALGRTKYRGSGYDSFRLPKRLTQRIILSYWPYTNFAGGGKNLDVAQAALKGKSVPVNIDSEKEVEWSAVTV